MATYLPVAEDTFKRDMSETGEKIPFLIGVAGGRASGKTTVCAQLIETLGQNEMTSVEKEVVSLSQDSFYRELTPQEITKAEIGMFNFDHPTAFDHHLMETVMKVYLKGEEGLLQLQNSFYRAFSVEAPPRFLSTTSRLTTLYLASAPLSTLLMWC